MTGTFIILILLLAPSVKPWFEQRAALSQLREDVAMAQAEVDALAAEADRWRDPDFLKSQARDRLNFVLPGQTLYGVIDDRRPAVSDDPGETAASVAASDRAWFADLWRSVEVAGDPASAGTVDGPPEGTTP